jgi:hypothetical protein
MRTKSTLLMIVAAFLVMAFQAWTAHADWPCCGDGFGCGSGYHYFLRSGYADDPIPYYTLHPPVYYSTPVPRTYGYSPFPYPPYVMTPEVVSQAPKTIDNPYVPDKPAASIKPAQFTQAPLRIANPYVTQPAGNASGIAVK